MKKLHLALAVAAGVCCASPALADGSLEATPAFSGTSVSFSVYGSYESLLLTVSGANGFHASIFRRGTAPSLNLREELGRALTSEDDGIYGWNLTGAQPSNLAATVQFDVSERIKADGVDENGRSADMLRAHRPMEPVMASGRFRVVNGQIQAIEEIAEE